MPYAKFDFTKNFMALTKEELKAENKRLHSVVMRRLHLLEKLEEREGITSPALTSIREYGINNFKLTDNLSQERNLYKVMRQFVQNPYSTPKGWNRKIETSTKELREFLGDESITDRQAKDFWDLLDAIRAEHSNRTIEGKSVSGSLSELYRVLTGNNKDPNYYKVWEVIEDVRREGGSRESQFQKIFERLQEIYEEIN